jgi:hypothetical protein
LEVSLLNLLFFFVQAIFGRSPVGQVVHRISRTSDYVDRLTETVTAERLRFLVSVDLNPEQDLAQEAMGRSVDRIAHYRLERWMLQDLTQDWALGDMLLKYGEWVQLQEYLGIDAHNRRHPEAHQITGIHGERLVEVGRLRFQDEELRELVTQVA